MPRDVKLVLLGDSGVGKSSLIYRFIHNDYRPFSESTIGASFMSKVINEVHFKVWDTAGQEKYRSLSSMYFRGASAAILVFDVTNTKSFEGLQSWVNDLMSHSIGKGNQMTSNENQIAEHNGIVLAICANKCDLLDSDGDARERQVSEAKARRYAKDIGAAYFETSAKLGTNVDDVFFDISNRLPIQSDDMCTAGPSSAFRVDFQSDDFAEQRISILRRCC